MKFLLDANIPYSAKEIFSNEYEVFLDFANILNYPPKRYYGIVVLRLPYFYSAKNIKDALFKFINTVILNDIPKSIIIVEEGRYRIRKE